MGLITSVPVKKLQEAFCLNLQIVKQCLCVADKRTRVLSFNLGLRLGSFVVSLFLVTLKRWSVNILKLQTKKLSF